jgi:hypothetical protein
MGKRLLTLSLSTPWKNAEVILKICEAIIYGDLNYISNSFCAKNSDAVAQLWIAFFNWSIYCRCIFYCTWCRDKYWCKSTVSFNVYFFPFNSLHWVSRWPMQARLPAPHNSLSGLLSDDILYQRQLTLFNQDQKLRNLVQMVRMLLNN